jgi:hypothetical protein
MMATFKVGQRVRKVAYRQLLHEPHAVVVPIGAEGVIRGFYDGFGGLWLVEYPGYSPSRHHIECGFGPYFYNEAQQLTPLTDPHADAFIEGIKKLKPYEEPKVVKERV